MELLKDLNKQQLEAVTAPLGPVLVLAGAGSGKTRALIYRIAYLIATNTFQPHQILAVTFTNKAATEMRERLEAMLGLQSSRPTLGTFHSICARLLRKEIHHLGHFNASFTIFDSDDSLRAIKQLIQDFAWDREVSPNYARSLISSIKNQQVRIEDIEEDGIVRLFKSYQALLQEVNALDFDDLLAMTVRLFKEHPKVLSKYRQMWQYVLVDEYQDTNNIQYELVRLLVDYSGGSNVFAVGDDAQSIYGFRGANYRNILNFEKDFRDATVVLLDQNYRSSQNILSAANEIIKLSKDQKEKNLWTQNSDGHKLIKHTAIDEVAEGMFVAGEIMKLASEKSDSDDGVSYEADPDFMDYEESATPFFDSLLKKSRFNQRNRKRPMLTGALDSDKLKDIAILYRTNAQSRAIEEVLLQYGIPYHLVGGVRFYERKEVKDVLAFLRILVNEKDSVSLSRIINVPPRGIGDKSLELIRKGEMSALSTRARNSWDNFQTKLASIRQTAPEAKLVEVIDVLIKKFSLEEFYRDGTTEGEDRWGNVRELLTVASRWGEMPWAQALSEFLEEIALYSETDEVGSKTGVTMMTLHQAKGLEFDIVFLIGLEEGLLPHMKSLEPGADINEEIRLAYVGFTRARKKLYLLNAHTRRIFGSSYTLKPSRILKAVPEELVEVRDGWGY